MGNENNDEVKLYAGKFKTVEELENGYKSSATVFEENTNLKKKLDEYRVPDAYQNPADFTVDAGRLADIQARAKEAGMTQAQYEKFLRSDKDRLDANQKKLEDARKALGEETMNILTDYVSKYYPKEIQDGVLKTFIGNEEARKAALDHRTKLLDNRVPGVEKVAPATNYHVSDKDIKAAYDQKEKTKSVKDINHYMNLLAQKAAQDGQQKAS